MYARNKSPDEASLDDHRERSTSKSPRTNAAPLSMSDLHRLISCLAYEIYLDRGKLHGHDLGDWLAAEEAVLSRSVRRTSHTGESVDGDEIK